MGDWREEKRCRRKERMLLVSKYWKKRGLAVLELYVGACLVELMFTLDYTLVTNLKVKKCEKVKDELENDIDFPMANVRKLTMVDGYSPKEKPVEFTHA